jgi:catechol 2,3-dioxygenase-like lactoylglutathione lyase family enzyme
MAVRIPGIHHVTALAGDPQQNLDFYTGVLGLRLVKLTVNFDDPETYHLYFGDEQGHPGTILTFFPWPGAARGRHGTGQLTVTAFSIPAGSMGYWADRLGAHGIEAGAPKTRFEEEVIEFQDPDGLRLELVAQEAPAAGNAWTHDGPVPKAHAIRGFHSVTLSEEGYERTARLLVDTLGFRLQREAGTRFRFETGGGGAGALVDVLCLPDVLPGRVAVGTVHHVAWRTPDADVQESLREDIAALGYNVTPVIDRKYFHSVYFREPGGVLFEIATDQPGFAVDEPAGELGTRLMLPPWLEPSRAELEARLPPLRLPRLARGA